MTHSTCLTSPRPLPEPIDVEPAAGRLLSVAELQSALRVVGAGRDDRTTAGGFGMRMPPSTVARALSAQAVRGSVPMVAVLAAHAGAGSSTVALAIADAAAATGRVHLVEWCGPERSGLASAAVSELGVRDGRWRRGQRGAVVIDRGDSGEDELAVPQCRGAELRVFDFGHVDPCALRGAAVVLVCRATVPGIRGAERALAERPEPAAVAVLGPPRWPGPVTATVGPRLRELRRSGRVVPVPITRRLEVSGLSSDPLPKPVLAAGGILHGLLLAAVRPPDDSTGAGHTTTEGNSA